MAGRILAGPPAPPAADRDLALAAVDVAYAEEHKRVFAVLHEALVVAPGPEEVAEAWSRYRVALAAALRALHGARAVARELTGG